MSSEPDILDGARQPRSRLAEHAGLGLAVAATVIGFALVAYAWWKVSALTNSAQQIPYLISGGLTGIGLIVVGSALLVVVTRSGDDSLRAQQAEALVEALRDLAARNEDWESQ